MQLIQVRSTLLTYHSVFELTEKGYTLLKHRELLTCVVFSNSFETAWFLRECQPWLLVDTPTQRQNGFTRSVDKVHSYHFVADDHYNVAHAQTSDRCVSAVFPLCLCCVSAVSLLCLRCRRCRCSVENASKPYTGFRLGCSARAKPNNMAAKIRK